MAHSIERMKVFTLKGFLSFGLLPLIIDAIFIYFLFSAVNLTVSSAVLLIVVGLFFWLPYVSILLTRREWMKNISFVTRQGLPVIIHDFAVKKEDVEAVIDETIKAWNKVLGNYESADAVANLFIEFQPLPVHHWRDLNKSLAGMLVGAKAVIGWKPKIYATALAHELGHEIYANHVGYYDNEDCHRFMAQNKLR